MMFEIEDFYRQKRGTKVVSFEPREEFEILDCSLLSSMAESASYCTNCKTPYVRVCPSDQSDKGMRLYRGIGWTIDTSGEYAAATEEDRDRQYPIAAKGYAAFLLSKVEYDEEDKEYYFENTDEALEQSYFKHVLQDVPKARRESKKQRYRVGCINREYYFNAALVELVKQKVEKFKAANITSVKVAETAILPKESANQEDELQDVRAIFSSDEDFNEFMLKSELVKTSNGYAKLIYKIDKRIFTKGKKGTITNIYEVLLKYKDKHFPYLRSYASFRQNYIVAENN